MCFSGGTQNWWLIWQEYGQHYIKPTKTRNLGICVVQIENFNMTYNIFRWKRFVPRVLPKRGFLPRDKETLFNLLMWPLFFYLFFFFFFWVRNVTAIQFFILTPLSLRLLQADSLSSQTVVYDIILSLSLSRIKKETNSE